MKARQFTENNKRGEPSPAGRLAVHVDGVGPPLVLLHGWSMNAQVWQPLLPELTARWRVYRVDLPGHGASAAVDCDGGLARWVDLIAAVVPESAHWLGWSLGGTLALALAANRPERVVSLTLAAATPRFVAAQDWQHAVSADNWHRFAGQCATDPAATLQHFMLLQSRGVAHPRHLAEQLRQAQQAGGMPSTPALRAGLEILQTSDLRCELQRLRVPTTIVLGEHDALVPAVVAGDLMQLNRALTIRIIKAAGHAAFVSHSAGFLAALEK